MHEVCQKHPAGGTARRRDRAGSTGPATITRCRSWMPAAGRSAGARSSTAPRACASWSSVLARAGAARPRSNAPDGPVIDALLGAGITVVVISPNQVKNLRGRYGSAGNKDDRFDAYVLADTLRTDRARLRPLTPDSPATIALRRACRARKDLVSHRVAVANQLRAHLRNVFPGAAGLFAELDSPVSLAFLARFDTQDRADWLTPARLAKWLASIGYSGRTDPAVLHARLTAAPRGLTGPDADRPAPPSPARCTPCWPPSPRRSRPWPPRSRTQLAAHADSHIFTVAAPLRHRPRRPAARRDRRLPRPVPHPRGAGLPRRRRTLHPPVRQASAPSPSAGPATSSSATPSPTSPATPATPTPGPPTSTSRARARGHDHPHAVRILARAWLYVIWHCWQDRHRLRPRPPPGPPAPPQPRSTRRRLDTGLHRFTGFCWPARSRHSWMKCSGLRNSSFSSAMSSMVKPSGRRIR